MYLDALKSLSITAFQGTRVGFIATWFELLADSLSYEMTKGLLLKSLQGDDDLPDMFTTLQETKNKEADIEMLRMKLQNKASLQDGKDTYNKGTKSSEMKCHLSLNPVNNVSYCKFGRLGTAAVYTNELSHLDEMVLFEQQERSEID